VIRQRNRNKIVALVATALAIAGVVVTARVASAAPVRYEAESATIFHGAVESNHAGFSGTGFVNFANEVGSYVQFGVTAATAGTATVALRYANGTTLNRPLDITVDGSLVADELSFAGTGAWSTWATRTITVPVTAGSHTVRAIATTVNGGPNLDFLDLEVAPLVTDFQAEAATISQGVVASTHAGFTGTGFVDYNAVAGSYVQFSVPAAVAGAVGLQFRFANGSTANRPMDITVNGSLVANDLAFNPTGAWTTWQTQTTNATLTAGTNTIRATAVTANGGPNLDRLRVTADSQAPTAPGQPSCSNIQSTSLTLSWGASTDNVGVVAYDIYHDGTKINEAPGNTTTRNMTGLQPSFTYRLSVFSRDAAGNVSNTSPLATCVTLAGETQPPTAPTNLVHSNVTQTTVNLTWGASTDDVGVTAYLVRNNANNAVLFTVTGNPPATSTTVTGLACNTTFTVHVVARDAALNISSPSNTRTFTTGACSRGQPQTPTTVSSNWTIPWDICFIPGQQAALITERDHFRVSRLTVGGTKTLIGTVPSSVTTDGEGGLMGCAVSPTWNGTTDTAVFFMHTSNDGGVTQNRVVRMTYNGSTLSGRTVILGGIRSNRFHNGGRIRFGPDGFLYVTTGDAQQSSLAQDVNSLNGKILRITKTGAAAPGNPFGGSRVYSMGHRNPQGIAWDSAGRLWSSEFGNATWDEVNLILPGRNYGWPTCEGSCTVGGMENPKWQRAPSECSCSGIAIVNDTIYMGALRGQRLWRLELTGTSVTATSSFFNGTFGRLRAVEKLPGLNAIWIGTSSADNNGGQPDGSDRILRSNIQ
jgi:glucose/arabinose dehydrogenase